MAIQENSPNSEPAIKADNTSTGPGILSNSTSGASIIGESVGGAGIFGQSQSAQGVWGVSHAKYHAGVSGINDNPEQEAGPGVYGSSQGTGVWGESSTWMGVFGKSNSRTGGAGVHGLSEQPGAAGVFGLNDAGTGVLGQSKDGRGVIAMSETNEALYAETHSSRTAAMNVFQANPASSTAALYAKHAGNGPAAVFEGNVHVHGDVLLMNADIAEDFTVADLDIEAGSVMTFDEEGLLVPCNSSYDKKVVGVISGAGSYKPGMILDKQDVLENRLPIALMGKVFCKVNADISPIQIGDLLTTSPITGCAMKAVDPYKSFGTVIGKALKPLQSGFGLIPILVTLQ